MTHGLGLGKPGPRAAKPITPPYVENNYRIEVKITFMLIAYLVLLCEFFWEFLIFHFCRPLVDIYRHPLLKLWTKRHSLSADEVIGCVYLYIDTWRVCQTRVYHSQIYYWKQFARHPFFLFRGIRLSPQTSKTCESTACSSLAERWTITEIRRLLRGGPCKNRPLEFPRKTEFLHFFLRHN